MADDQQRDAERFTEILHHNGGCPRSGNAITRTHRAAFIDQQADGKVDRLCRETGVVEDTAIVPVKRMLIQPLSNQEPGLFSTLPPITESRAYAALQSLREHQKLRSHAVVAIYEVLIYMCHAIDRHMDIAMHVSVSDGIRFTLKVLGKLFFQFFRHFLLRDGG